MRGQHEPGIYGLNFLHALAQCGQHPTPSALDRGGGIKILAYLPTEGAFKFGGPLALPGSFW